MVGLLLAAMNSSNKKTSRRFIAAARCPKCGKQDTLYFVGEIGGDFTCVECLFESASPVAPSDGEAGIVTSAAGKDIKNKRGNKNVTNKALNDALIEEEAGQTQPLKIIDNTSDKN